MAKREHIAQGPNRVREWRKKAGLTLKEAAPAIGLSWTHLARIESGERELNQAWLERMAPVFQCAAADLLSSELGGLSPEERDMVNLMRALPDPNRAAILAMLDSQRQFLPQPGGADVVELPRKTG
ncbi:helix-turn-helix domain-containing protein [Novosphingobium huizhouense]|uniref:helix-turn-helix domain-containing protein n=1 Tax=Novosphingobium huizhouense TaxID=2866625 RepID=UPI001CD81F59|nr:helix-turn-helix transcriptional regulator [Novosphingobium huizhouense]